LCERYNFNIINNWSSAFGLLDVYIFPKPEYFCIIKQGKMKNQFHKLVLAVLLVSIILNSCVSLKSVDNFSSTSLNGLKKFEEINYSFQQHCIERCQFEAIKEFDIKKETDCKCDIYKQADKATLLIYNSIKGYLTGLANLSNNNLTDYSANSLEKSLKEGAFGDISIEKKHVEAYSTILEILSRSITDGYRKNKIEIYVEEANEPIQVLLDKFQFILKENLEVELDFKKERLFDYYQDMKLNNTISDYEKGKATIDYYQQLFDIDAKQKQIGAFARSLKSISDGHQKLYDNRNKMSANELKVLLASYTSDIQDIISEINKLKK